MNIWVNTGPGRERLERRGGWCRDRSAGLTPRASINEMHSGAGGLKASVDGQVVKNAS